MPPTTPGLHHVTAIAGDPQANADFYVETLGLRFVKRTVNHDDTGTYHFYFGDYEGTPGTNITFFPWTESGRDGQFGAGQTRDTAYLIPPESVDYWVQRLHERGVDVEEDERFGDTVLRFADPDGVGLELIASEHARDSDAVPWPDGPVPAEHQLRGFHSVTLAVREFGPTEEILTDVLGYERVAEDGDRRRYRTPEGGAHALLDLVETEAARGTMGVGTVHHVAFTARSVDELEAYEEAYAERGLAANGPIDRKYFQSLYCREPGGVLFEIATDGPGFDADEPVEELGSSLVLPDWLEADREAIEAALPDFVPPAAGDGGE
ncbi:MULTISPECIES: ring-cleaving dioxygenase [Halobacterium]|uniref:ring-cleaving dioxygenase n=1 Tax=Halobacterium TaxID=2239 RepID=UPI00073EA0F9|nr:MULTISPECIES: ring-cleaving dioxygenase [Halobacterium]MCG1004260.1 ring-cleaving dioxygenase [Halobacterium noricense]